IQVQEVSPLNMVQTTITDAMWVTVQFRPGRIGTHEAQLVIESNSDTEPTIALNLSAEGARDVAVKESGGAGVTPITDFPMTGIGAANSKIIYARNTGTIGRVTFTGIQIVGSPAFTFTSYGRAAHQNRHELVKP